MTQRWNWRWMAEWAIAAVAAVGPGVASAQSAALPTTAPATAPATKRSMAATPVEALEANGNAMSRGDSQGILQSYQMQTLSQKEVAAAYVHLAQAMGDLRRAALAAYGPDGFDQIGFGDRYEQEKLRLGRARVEIAGDTAMAHVEISPNTSPRIRGPESTIYLVKEDGAWKIDADRTFKDPRRQAARIGAQASAYDELAQEIAAGKYPLAIKARLAGREKVESARRKVDEQLRGATRPATRGSAEAATQPQAGE